MKNNCIFCKIVDGELPSNKIYEDDCFYVMLDKFPQQLGHTLILPKRHAVQVFDLNEGEARRLISLTQKIGVALREVVGFSGLKLVQNNGADAGQEVFHFHLHLIPMYEQEKSAKADFPELAEKIAKALAGSLEFAEKTAEAL